MMIRSKTVKLNLPFGHFSFEQGYMECRMPNWTGMVCRVQRGALADERVARLETLKRPSVYILIGADAVSMRPRVYVGQSVQPAQRLRDHLARKAFWDAALVITTNEDPHCALGATELNYLENCF